TTGEIPPQRAASAVDPDLALYPQRQDRISRNPNARTRPRTDRVDPRSVSHTATLAGRRAPARAAHGLRRPTARRQADLLIRTLAHRPPRHHHRPRPQPAHPALRHLGSPAQTPGPR